MTDGYNRIKELYLKLKQKDESMIKIVTFLMKQPNMNELYLNEEKNLEDMMEYIKDLAKEKAVNNVAVIPDDEVYKWINNYFSKSNDELGINKQQKVTKDKSNKTDKDKNESKDNDQLKLDV